MAGAAVPPGFALLNKFRGAAAAGPVAFAELVAASGFLTISLGPPHAAYLAAPSAGGVFEADFGHAFASFSAPSLLVLLHSSFYSSF